MIRTATARTRFQPFRGILTLALLFAASLAMTDGAGAQGTFGTLPQPINSADLDYYAEYLDLSDQQVLAISEHQRQYLEQFRALRDSDIDDFLASMQDMRRGFSIGNISRFEPMIRDINRLLNRIRNVDEQFFNQMQTVLTDEQSRKLQRLRQRRERARYSSEITRGLDFINPAARIDLTEILDQIDLPRDVLEHIDPQLAQYENRLTTMARSMWETTTKTFTAAIKEVDALGIDEDTMNEPREMMRLFQEGQRIWDEVSEDLREESAKLAALHRQHYRSIASLLPDDARRLFRQRYLQRAYREAARLTVEPWREVEKALSLDELPPRLRTSVQAMAMSHDQQQDRRISQIADLLDEFRRDLTMQAMFRRGQDPTMQQVQELREEGERADERFIEELHALLGEPWSAMVEAAPAPRRPTAQRPAMRFQRTFSSSDPTAQPGMRWPRPISGRDLTLISEMLEISEDRFAVLESLHSDYADAYNAARRQHMPAILQMMVDPEDDSDGFSRRLNNDELNELIELVRRAIDDARKVEDRFFDDVRHALLGDDGRDRIEAARAMRDCLFHLEATPEVPPQLIGGPVNNPGNTEGGVNFRAMIAELSLTGEQRQQLHNLLIEHELEARELLQQRFDVDVEISLRNWQIALRMQDLDNRGRAWRMMRSLRDPMQRSQAINRDLAHVNRETLIAALDMTPRHEQSVLRDQYNRQGFPTVYDDPDSPEANLLSALNLSQLSDRQRSRVQDLMMEFRIEYQQLSQEIVDRMMELTDIDVPERRGRMRPGQAEAPEAIARDGLRNSIERIQFDRDELNQRTHRKLRAILGAEQYQRMSMRSAD